MDLVHKNKPKIFSGYYIVIASFFIAIIMHGMFATFGVFFTPMLTEFGWSRAAFSAANSIGFVTSGLFAVIMGALCDKIGPRIVMSVGGVLYCLGHIFLAQTSTLWQLYLFWMIIGIGFASSDVVPLTTIARWFSRKRGTMSGIAKVGTGLGMVLLPLIAAVLIDNFGWRISYTVLGMFILISVIPLSLMLRRDPYQTGELPDGERMPVNTISQISEQGLSLREALSIRQLWIIIAIYFIAQFCANTMIVHIVPHAVDLGASLPIASSVLAIIGGLSILGRLVMGFINDRIGNKRTIVICFIILLIALGWLQFTRAIWMLYLFAVIYGFGHGGFFALISPTIAVYFGTRSQGVLLGTVMFGSTIGGALGAYLTGKIFDISGSYSLAFLIMLIVSILGLILSMSIKPLKR